MEVLWETRFSFDEILSPKIVLLNKWINKIKGNLYLKDNTS